MSKPMASSDIFSSAGRSTAVKAILAPAATAVEACVGSFNPADRLFSVRSGSARRLTMTKEPHYRNILLERRGAVGIVTLNRPAALNALNAALVSELGAALSELEDDAAIGAIVLTGNDKAFASGADVKEMVSKSYPEIYGEDFITRGWGRVGQCRIPVIAAVAGFALGGGCEIAMMCDIIIAAETAHFGQPEITLGTMPGAGGTQRLTRFVGKAKAMDLCLTGRMMDAAEAERAGLVSR